MGENYEALPLVERCQHRLWRARVSGYEEAFELFRRPVINLQNEVRSLFIVENNFYSPSLALLCSEAAVLPFLALLV